ncbi:MAG: hypothetical protein LIO99_04435 [Clostridiales bacterium]|nr:hypothetical protein [Clostridiales bacterium]
MKCYCKFTNYEKLAWCTFGCPSRKRTIDNLRIAAQIETDPEKSEKLLKLIDKIQRSLPFGSDYQHDFYTCSHELEQTMIQNVLDYQTVTGDLENGSPWKNYAMALLVSSFCTADRCQTLGRLDVLSKIIVKPEAGSILLAVMLTVNGIFKDEPEKYENYLNRCHEAVRRGELRKKKGHEKFQRYVWEMPCVMSEWEDENNKDNDHKKAGGDAVLFVF